MSASSAGLLLVFENLTYNLFSALSIAFASNTCAFNPLFKS